MSDWKGRVHTTTFTEEMAHAYDYDHTEIREVVEDKAEQLENSINGVVLVERKVGARGIEVKVIHGRSAAPGIIRRQLKNMQSEVLAEMHPDRDGMWEGPK